MITRFMLLIVLLAAAVGVPYLATQGGGMLQKAKQAWAGSEQPPPQLEPYAQGDPTVAQIEQEMADTMSGRSTNPPQPPLEGFATYDLAEVLRMDVNATWVYNRWPRKSTAIPDLHFYGIRVPLVTGVKVDDLAGSLTYYFNSRDQVQRISFRGRTGNTRRLVELLRSKYGFRRQHPDVPGEELYQVRWNAKPQSELRIRPASVIWASVPHASFEVELELERPGSPRFIGRR